MDTALPILNTVDLIRLNNGLNLRVNPITEKGWNFSTGNSLITVEYKPILPDSFFGQPYYETNLKPQPNSFFTLLVPDRQENIASQPYIDPLLDLTLSLSPVNNLETDLIKYFKTFDSVRKIFISKSEAIKDVRIVLDLDKYDINYMEELFSKAQFPIQDKYSDQEVMLNFEYIFSNQEQNEYLGKCIYTSLSNV